MGQIDPVQLSHVSIKRIVGRIALQAPVLLSLLIPFTKLPDLIAHEVQLLSRMHHHVQVHCPRMRKLVFILTVHFVENGSLSMNNFIMGKRQKIAVIVKVHHREGQLVIPGRSVCRCGLKILERVMHPSHIPFVVKSTPTVIYIQCHIRIVCRILSNQNTAGLSS